MLTAKDIMTKDVITVKPDTTVEELARLLMDNKINESAWNEQNVSFVLVF